MCVFFKDLHVDFSHFFRLFLQEFAEEFALQKKKNVHLMLLKCVSCWRLSYRDRTREAVGVNEGREAPLVWSAAGGEIDGFHGWSVG